MRSGLLIERVELWRKETTQSTFGDLTEDWSKVRDLRCYVHRKSGKEVMVSDEVIDISKIRIQLRNQYDIWEQDRIKHNGSLFKIDLIQHMDIKKRFLMIYCSRLNE